MTQQQNYDYFLVLDFEATCQQGLPIDNQEIIEFPVLKIDGKSFHIVDQFHHYVRPVRNPHLTDFCTKLTGITQEMVDDSEPFRSVFGDFEGWVTKNVGDNSFLFVTCGDWDLKKMLPEQCKKENVDLPPYFRTWMNIKKTYAQVTGTFVKGMMPMIKELNLKHVGRHHSGIDDCINIAHILEKLADLGTVFGATSVRKEFNKQRSPKNHHQRGRSSETDEDKSSFSDLPQLSLSSERESNVYPLLPINEVGQEEAPAGAEATACSMVELSPQNSTSNVNYETIIARLKDNLSSPKFKPRDVDELTPLLVATKYMDAMTNADRIVLENRLRYFYVGLCHGWKVASKDAKAVSTASVGIHINPEDLTRRDRRSKHKQNPKGDKFVMI